MSNFYLDVIKKDPRFASTEQIGDVALLEPGMRAAVAKMIAAAKVHGHDIRVTETYRSQARQQHLYAQHLTQLRDVGVHGFGLACDLALFIKGKQGNSIYDPNGAHYGFYQALAVGVGLVSGIGWGTPQAKHTFTDWDHVQRVPVFRQNALFAGGWYPDEIYNPYADMLSFHVAGMNAQEVAAA